MEKKIVSSSKTEMKINVEITQKETRIVKENLKGVVHKYGNNDTFQFFQKLLAQHTYIIIYLISNN